MWNVKIETVNTSQHRISNSDYNGMIQPGVEASFGRIIRSAVKENNNEIINIKLNY